MKYLDHVPEELRPLIQELTKAVGKTVNVSISESDSVGDACVGIRRAGYEAVLVLQVGVKLCKLGDAEMRAPRGEPVSLVDIEEATARAEFEEQGGDNAWLGGLHIKLDDDEPS
jgi:hypothetical protein